MANEKTLLLALLCMLTLAGYSQQKIVGMWKNIDDEDGKEKSHIEIYEKKWNAPRQGCGKTTGKCYHGVCEKCTGANKTSPSKAWKSFGTSKNPPIKNTRMAKSSTQKQQNLRLLYLPG